MSKQLLSQFSARQALDLIIEQGEVGLKHR